MALLNIKEKEDVTRFTKDLLAGGMSGIFAKTLGAPIERIKLLMQTQHINHNLQTQYKNPIDCVRKIYHTEGVLAFWRGNLANVYRYFPSQAMNFAFNDKYKAFFTKLFMVSTANMEVDEWGKARAMAVSLLCGGLAGATALSVSYPFDVARTRLAVDVNSANSGSGTTTGCNSGVKCSNSSNGTSSTSTANLTTTRHLCTSSNSTSHSADSTTTTTHSNNISKQLPSIKPTTTTTTTTTTTAEGGRVYRGTVDCLRTTYALEGIRGVYAGFGVSLAGVFVFRALYLGGWDIVKTHYELQQASVTARLLAAQAVTTIVGTVCFPIDTIKRRLMMQQRTNGFVPYKNGYDCMYRILQEEGIRGMFSGLSVNLVRGFSGAVLLVAYDDLKHRL